MRDTEWVGLRFFTGWTRGTLLLEPWRPTRYVSRHERLILTLINTTDLLTLTPRCFDPQV